MFLMRAYPLRGEVGRGWALEFSSFLGPVKWHRALSTPLILPLQLSTLASAPPTPHRLPTDSPPTPHQLPTLPPPIQHLLEINSKL
jgi:hypothetical protein